MEKKERRTGVYLPSCVRKREINVQRNCRPKREEKTDAEAESFSKDQNCSSPGIKPKFAAFDHLILSPFNRLPVVTLMLTGVPTVVS